MLFTGKNGALFQEGIGGQNKEMRNAKTCSTDCDH